MPLSLVGLLFAGACALGGPPPIDDTNTGTRPPVSSSSGGTDASTSSSSGFVDSGTPELDANVTPDATVDAKADTGPVTDSGPDAMQPRLSAGDLLISEVMYNPSGAEPNGEWIEIFNPGNVTRSLLGLTIYDSAGRTHTITGNVMVAPNAYAVLVRKIADSGIPSAKIAYEYGLGVAAGSGIQLTNANSGYVQVRDGATVVAEAKYGAFGVGAEGASAQLKVVTYAGSQVAQNWCTSAKPWVAGSDKGTPGDASDCP